MSLNLMTGYAGEPHVTSADDGAVNAAIYGASKYVLNTGQKFAYELISNNLIKIKDGYAINQGRKIGQAISDYEELTIDNGLQGVKRSDIIAIRYSKNLDTGIESADFVVIKGTSGDTYKDPEHITGNIIHGDAVDDFPLYRVKIDGLSVSAVEPLFNVLVSMEEMQNEITSINSNFCANNAGAHNSIYRGKNLGTSVTEAQYNAIGAGTFEDLYIGDYWVINGVNWRIAAFDYYINSGNLRCTEHHVVIVPDDCLYDHVMNDTDITTGGYVGSKIYTEGLEQAKTTIKAAFSGHVLSHRVYLTNTVNSGHPSGGAWYDGEVDLMNEQMVFGGAIFMPISIGSTVYANYRVEKSQLPLFAHEPSRICNRYTWWLRDVASASAFTIVGTYGDVQCTGASKSFGVRPAFCISK